MQGKWIKKRHRFSSGEYYRIGSIVVGGYHDAPRGRNDPLRYRCQFDLPGLSIKPEHATKDTIEEAKQTVEKTVARWFALLNSTEE